MQVGFKYICDVMIRHDIAFGGEESGGFGYGVHIPERDGIFSSLLLLEMLATSSCKTLSEYFKRKLSTLGQIYYNRMDLVYRYENKNDLLPQLFLNSPRMINGFRVFGIQSFCSSRNIVNGIKFLLGPCRWLLIRSSETEDIIRFYAEGQSEKETEMLLSCGREILGI